MAALSMNNRADNRKARVLLAEDHPLVRAGIKSLLDAEPDLEVCGETGALGNLSRLVQSTEPDILILDLSLSDGIGLGAIKRLRNEFPKLRILVCSMHDESIFAYRCLQLGASGYVNKRAANNSIVTAIRSILQNKRYLSPAMTERLLEGASRQGASPEDYSLEGLSTRELEVFTLIGQGLSTAEIAEKLHLSGKAIETHREKIKKKLSLRTSNELNRYAVQWFMENH